MTTFLLAAMLIGILAFAIWAVARDIRQRLQASDLSARQFWRQEALGWLRGFLTLVFLLAVNAWIRSLFGAL